MTLRLPTVNDPGKTSSAPRHTEVSKSFFQPKLTVNHPDDPFEREADAIAHRVVKMEKIQNFTGSGEGTFFGHALQRKCAHWEEEENKVQRKGSHGTPTLVPKSTSNYVSNLSGGQSLTEKERSFFEPRMGYDFRDIKIHTGSEAAESAKSINALAYTTGKNIVFNRGQYSPDTESGKRLLAHELAHTVQQSNDIHPKIQRYVDSVEINCADNEIRFLHNGTVTSYTLNHCQLTDNTYNAGVALSPGRVDFDLGEVPQGTQFDFNYSIAPGQPSPNTFFTGQSRVNIVCSNTSSGGLGNGSVHFSVRQLTAEDVLALTGTGIDSIPEGIMVPLGNFTARTLRDVSGPAVAGASYFSPTPWSFIPRNTTGILWTQGHTSVWSHPEGLFSSPTIRGYRGNLAYYAGELLPVFGRQFTVRLHEGVPGTFANDAWFPIMAGEQYYVFAPQSAENAQSFAERLQGTRYGGEYTYSPPRAAGAGTDPHLGPVGRTEGSLHSELSVRGRAPLCTNNCITVPTPEIEAAIGGRPITTAGVDVMTGTGPGGTADPHYAGRGRLMTEAMREGPLPPGAQRLNLTVTPGGSAGMFIVRGAGRVMLVYGIYHTADRISESVEAGNTATVVTEEAGAWVGGILGSALGGAAAGAILCAPTGPIDAVCVVGGFLGGLLFGAVGGTVGHAVGHEAGERVVTPVVDRVIQEANQFERGLEREIYNLYGVPFFP